ncbi:30S ribosomal protein S7 [Halococcoides cellulosivorans]|uniref:Small ribosomal subunit protein uS7 n=1 Tax=Halococcoides cellulosivorans TaxID=1679096 RepID=A0A2R4X276_9EURY|nr:30S ribosomal protein S7 [Halococcoides cellulosivorans]AWB27891.1 30S ribosomal protein S7 [Halococcoides cellulosivorans]
MSAESESDDTPEESEESTIGAKLFGEYATDGIEFSDPSTERYVTITPIAHTMGRHTGKQFDKSEISIVERLINRLMQTDENTGKKQQTTRIVREAFAIIESRADENPIQVLVGAVENAAPREETVRLKYGGISVPKAVDISPQRRVDQALKFIAEGVYKDAFKTTTDAEDALARQLIGAADDDVDTYAVNQKEEKERVAAAAR